MFSVNYYYKEISIYNFIFTIIVILLIIINDLLFNINNIMNKKA